VPCVVNLDWDNEMMTENEVGRVWQRMVEAEVRSMYFADLASKYTKLKQAITGVSFFLSSAAAATVIAASPKWIPAALAVIVAILMAYSIAVNLDGRISTLSKLHYEWNRLDSEYERLWNHWNESDAENVLHKLIERGREISEIAAEMPYDEEQMNKWARFVYSRFSEAKT
jgi:hypothetical protein